MAITAKVETITAKVAEEYLKAQEKNRPPNQAHLMDLMGRQRRGEWVTNGDTIRFDSEGHLRDGQHRLKMVVMTEIPIETVVVRGVSPDAFVTMDTGKHRNLADVLSIKGYENSTLLSGTVRYVRVYVNHEGKVGVRWSHEQQSALLAKHPGIEKSVSFFLGLNSPKGAPQYKSIIVSWHYLFGRVSPEASNDFIERLVTGLHLDEPNDPVYRLRNQLVSNPNLVNPLKGYVLFAMGIFAWNAKQKGAEQKNAYRTPKTMPLINGFPKNLMEPIQGELIEDTEETNGDD